MARVMSKGRFFQPFWTGQEAERDATGRMCVSCIARCQFLGLDATYSVVIWPKRLKNKKTKNKHITHKLTTNRTWQLVWGPKAIHGTAFKGTPLFSQTGSKQRRETKLKPQPLQAGFLCGGISTTCPWGLHHLDGPTDLPPAESFLTWCHYVSLDVLELMM